MTATVRRAPADTDRALVAHDLWFAYDDTWIVRGVDLRVDVGEVVGLWGPSGGGKSTLARLLTGRLTPQHGTVSAPPSTTPARSVQLVLQHSGAGMNPRWKIREVLAEAAADISSVIDSGLVPQRWMSSFPHELSGGELQRVNLARALLSRPAFIIADEITASLDPITQVEIWDLLLQGTRAGEYGMVAVSHDRPLLERIADRIVAMADLNRPV